MIVKCRQKGSTISVFEDLSGPPALKDWRTRRIESRMCITATGEPATGIALQGNSPFQDPNPDAGVDARRFDHVQPGIQECLRIHQEIQIAAAAVVSRRYRAEDAHLPASKQLRQAVDLAPSQQLAVPPVRIPFYAE